MTPRPGRAAAWVLALLSAGVALRLAATGDLAAPPLGSLDQLTAWADAREPVAAAVALARLVAEVAVWYVLAVSAVHVASGARRVTGGHHLADALAAPGVRRLVHAGLGVGLAAASSVSTQDEVDAPGTATMTPLAAPEVTQTPVQDLGGSAAMRPAPVHLGEAADVQMAAAPGTWTVSPGESLWTIAEELLTEAWSRSPSAADVDPFWRDLVERNRGRLVDPADPDLIQPGQVFDVPPLPPAG